MSHPCVYEQDHYKGDVGYVIYDPNARNANNQEMGAWVIVDKEGNSIFQADFCPHCGKELPLKRRGLPLPNQEAEQWIP